MPATTLEIYNRLLSGERISVKLESKQRYDVLRTELCRHHRITRDLLGLSEDAICSRYENGIGSFHVGKPDTGKSIKMFVSSEERNE